MAGPLKRSPEERPLTPFLPHGTPRVDSAEEDSASSAAIQRCLIDTSISEVLGPLLRQAPSQAQTPRRVSFVVPEHSMAGHSTKVHTISDNPALTTGKISEGHCHFDFGDFSLELPKTFAPAVTSTFKQSRKTVSPPPGSTVYREDEKVDTQPPTSRQIDLVQTGATVRHTGPHKSKLAQGLNGLWKNIWTPVGVLSTIYGLLIVAWGAFLFFLLMGWTHLPLYQSFQWVEICSQVLTALFAITGIGFIPWRVRDSYHIMVIADYSRLARVREKRQLVHKTIAEQPPNEMSDIPPSSAFERALLQQQESTAILVLTERERRHLRRSVRVLAKSKPWFRPLSTMSHRVTSFGVVASIILLNDLNSVFQCILCGFMWFVLSISGAILTTLAAGILMAISSLRATNPVGKNRMVFDQWEKEVNSAHDGNFIG